MGLVSANRLNRFWQKGVKPIKDAIGVLEALSTVDKTTLVAAINELATGKFDVSKIVASTNITEPGFAMDGKTASEALAELYSKIFVVSFSGAKDGDIIPLGRTIDRSGHAFPLPHWNTATSVRCIYDVISLKAGDTGFKLNAYDTQTGTRSTSTTLSGRAIVILS